MYVALIDAITSVLIANYSDRTLIMDRCGKLGINSTTVTNNLVIFFGLI